MTDELAAIAAGEGDDAEALATLRTALVADRPEVRVAAAAAARDRMAEALSSDLADGLDDPVPGVRAAMAEALGVLHYLLGADADPEAVEALADALQDEEAGVRLAAAMALARIGPEDRATRALISVAADYEDPEAWLSQVAACGAAAVPALLEALDLDEHRSHALRALGRVGRGVMHAVEPLSLIARRGGDDAEAACLALTGAGPAAVPVLARLLEDPVGREPALKAIPALGPAGEPLAEEVARHAGEHPHEAAAALAAIRAVEPLSHLLDTGTVAQRLAVLAALEPDDELSALPMQALVDPQLEVRAAAVDLLGGWGEIAVRVGADVVLTGMRDDPAAEVRSAVEQALRRLG